MSKLADWLKKAREDGTALNDKIVARAGVAFNASNTTLAESVIRATVIGAFKGTTPETRARTMVVLCALYCPNCGNEQPDDPGTSCSCTEKH